MLMTKKDSVAVTGAKENRNKTSRTLNWLTCVRDGPCEPHYGNGRRAS
jgi:hypothetical protein